MTSHPGRLTVALRYARPTEVLVCFPMIPLTISPTILSRLTFLAYPSRALPTNNTTRVSTKAGDIAFGKLRDGYEEAEIELMSMWSRGKFDAGRHMGSVVR